MTDSAPVPDFERTTNQAVAWLRADREAGRRIWFQKCLSRQRTARNLPGGVPSALAAQHMVPMSDRVYDQDKFLKGMAIFLDNPDDSNPFGHVVSQVGRTASGLILVDTNDALIHGGGSVVTLDWFPPNWGVPVVFGSKSLNGFDLDLPGHARTHPKPEHHNKPSLNNLHYIEHRLGKSIAYWEKPHGGRHHPGLVRALRKDLAEVEQTIATFGKGR